MGLGVNVAASPVSVYVDKALGQAKSLGNAISSGMALKVLTEAGEEIDKLKAKAGSKARNEAGELDPGTRNALAGLFGGVPGSTVFLFLALGVGAFLVLRKGR